MKVSCFTGCPVTPGGTLLNDYLYSTCILAKHVQSVSYLFFALLSLRGASVQKSACLGLAKAMHDAKFASGYNITWSSLDCGSTLVEGLRSPLAHVATNMSTLHLPRARFARASHFRHTATSGVPAILRYIAVPT